MHNPPNTTGEQLTLTAWGGIGEVTGANFLIQAGGYKFLVDCGLMQGEEFAEERNRDPFPYEPAEIPTLIITHAHLDHIGRIPKLVRDGFSGSIFSTPETKELAAIMFDDALELLEQAARAKGILPLYDKHDVERALSLWKTAAYHTRTELAPGLDFILKDAGHILGSAMVEIHWRDQVLVCTGDLGNTPAPLLMDTEPLTGVQYLLMESVYGDRNHEPQTQRDQEFLDILKDTIARGGTAVIPAFSLERTQNILYILNNFVEDGLLPSVPVFLDSPLAIRVTEIYRHSTTLFNPGVQAEIRGGDDIFNFPKLRFTLHRGESRLIHRTPSPKIILAGSGMSAGGRVTEHEKEYLPDPKSSLILVGFQALGTLGRALQERVSSVTLGGVRVPVRAKIVNIRGFSSHKDLDGLVNLVETALPTLKRVFVAMGEPKASSFLAQRVHDYLDVPALVPERGKTYTLA